MHGFSPNQLVFGKNPNFPNIDDNLLPALEGSTTSKIVADNLKAMHYETQQYIKSDSSDKIARALRSQTRTFSDTKYLTGDMVYYRRKNCDSWKGLGTVITQDGQQALVNYASPDITVHPFRLSLNTKTAVETQENENVANSTNRIIATKPAFSKSNTDPKIHVMDESDSDPERETKQALNKP